MKQDTLFLLASAFYLCRYTQKKYTVILRSCPFMTVLGTEGTWHSLFPVFSRSHVCMYALVCTYVCTDVQIPGGLMLGIHSLDVLLLWPWRQSFSIKPRTHWHGWFVTSRTPRPLLPSEAAVMISHSSHFHGFLGIRNLVFMLAC